MQYSPVNLVTRNPDFPSSPGHQLGPSATRRGAQRGLTRALTLVLPRSEHTGASDPLFDRFVAGILDEAATSSFALSLFRANDFTDERSPYLRQIGLRGVDGFFVVRTLPQDTRIGLLQAHRLPFVVYGRTLDGNAFPHADIDSESGMRKMVDHLVGIGHTRIGGIMASTALTESIHRRCGLQAALQDRGMWNSELMVESHCTREASYKAARQLLGRSKRPTAIVCGSDLMAVGACAAAADAGLAIGRDVSIGGFDDVFEDNIHPGLTTIRNPAYEIGRMLCQMLMELVTGGEPRPSQVVLEPDLVIRQSTGPVIE